MALLKRVRRHLSYANVMSTLAVFGVFTGTAFAAGWVDTWDIVDGSIRGRDIAADTVASNDIKNGGIAGLDIANEAITGGKIRDGAVGGADVANGSLDGADIENGGIGTSDIADGSIDSNDIENGTITSGDIGSGGITESDLADDAISTRAIGNVPTVRVYHSGNQNVTMHGCCFNGDTITWDSEAVDTDTMHDAVNPSRITINTPGVYMIVAHAHWNSDASGWYTAWVFKNGVPANLLSQGNIGDTAGTDEIYEVTTIQTLAAGDYLEVAGNVENGGPAVFYGGDKGSQFMATWLGPSS